jgi:hypothetical protein
MSKMDRIVILLILPGEADPVSVIYFTPLGNDLLISIYSLFLSFLVLALLVKPEL